MTDYEIMKILPATMAMVKKNAHFALVKGDYTRYAQLMAECAELEKTLEAVQPKKLYLVK